MTLQAWILKALTAASLTYLASDVTGMTLNDVVALVRGNLANIQAQMSTLPTGGK